MLLGHWSVAKSIADGHWSFVKSVEEDHGTYFRLRAKLTYQTEPQDFDIVVGCNVRQINYKDNGSTYEAGLVPTVFGRRMSDGKGLAIRPPRACKGETTASGKIPPDLLPLVVVYDDANTLDFGIAHLSEDAYESPLSVLVFGGASVETATRQEFDEFRSAQTNLVTCASYWSALAGSLVLRDIKLSYIRRHWAHECQAYERYQIPEEARASVHENWPKMHPRYWTTDTWEEERALSQATMPHDHVYVLRNDHGERSLARHSSYKKPYQIMVCRPRRRRPDGLDTCARWTAPLSGLIFPRSKDRLPCWRLAY